MRTDDMSEHESRRSARVNYNLCRQGNGESLLNFTNRFRQCRDILEAVGEVVPADGVLAVDYLEALDKRIYGDMIR